jgi:DNA-binding NarL/FixJ family response regulator
MRALVIADSRFVAESIQRSLRADGSIHVIGYVDGRRSCGQEVTAAEPDAVVFDEMVKAGLAATRVREVRVALPTAKLVVLAGGMREAWLAEMVEAGAHAAISKSLHAGGIAMLVHEICRGTVYHAFAQPAHEAVSAPTHSDLTPRESEILLLVAKGASNGDIATRLCVTEQTVKFHLSNVYRKLKVTNRTQAGYYAHTHQLVDPIPVPAPPVPLDQAA